MWYRRWTAEEDEKLTAAMGMYQKSGPPGHKKLQYPPKHSSNSSKNKTHATTTAATTSTTAAADDIATGASNTFIDSNNADNGIAANYTDNSIVSETDRVVLASWKDVAAFVGTRDAGEIITVMYCSGLSLRYICVHAYILYLVCINLALYILLV